MEGDNGPGTGAEPRGLGPDYWKLWTSSAISNLGDGIRAAAFPLLAYRITQDPGPVALVATAATLPWFLFALPAGALVDRLDRRRVMASMNVARALVIALLSVAILTDTVGMAVLYLVAFLLGMAEVMFDNAAQTIMPAVVRRDQLETANGRLYGAEIVTNSFVGPPLGGLLFTAAAAIPFLVNAPATALSAMLILTIGGSYRPERAADMPRTRLTGEIAEGVRWLRAHRLLRTLAGMVGVSNFLFAGSGAVLVVFARELLGVGELGFSVLLTTFAVGSLLGTFLARRVSRRFGSGPALFLSVLLPGLANLVIGLTSNPFLFGALAASIGVSLVVWNVITVSLRQSIIPDHLLGRVNSVYRFLAWGTMPLGAAFGGLIAETLGLRAPYLFAGVVGIVMAFAALPIVNTRTVEAARADAPLS